NIEMAGGLKSMFFGGEGFFLATLNGTGTVFLQSLPFSRMADRILQHAPKAGGTRKGEGSVLGGLGDLINGS
ncbi:MAG: AIM24 family protein, partial [Deltaproteobacteria bacterium]|nr:AIM24 family protein [Deltaproteobacteria bacterium]